MVASNSISTDTDVERRARGMARSTLLVRLAGGAWLVGAAFLGFVTLMWPPAVIVTLPWAAAMLILGLHLAGGGSSTRWLVASALFAGLSLVPYGLDPQGPAAYPFLVALAVAGLASILALAVRRPAAR